MAKLRLQFEANDRRLWRLMGLALLAGTIAGFAAVAMYFGIAVLTEALYGASEETLATDAGTLPAWRLLGTLTGVGLAVGLLIQLIDRKRAHGVPDVIEAAALKEGELPVRAGLTSALVTIVSLGGGASAGREGPVVHLGATMASTLARLGRLKPGDGRILLACGVASAVAASFNAPIAGVLFALEVILGYYALHAFAPVVVASIAGTLISRIFIGDDAAFQVTDHEIQSFLEFPAFFVVGIVGSLMAALFMWMLQRGDAIRTQLDQFLPTWSQPAIGGFLIGLIALMYPEVLGVGYEATTSAINGHYGLAILLPLIAAKLLATVITLSSRFGGGIFSPSLVFGALSGGAIGLVAASVMPGIASSEGLYAVVGMGAVASAVLGAPISTILIVFEITGDYSITIAVMIASATSSIAIRLFQPRSFFHWQLFQRGVSLDDGRASYLLESEKVADYMSRDFLTVQADAPLSNARDMLVLQDGGVLVVTEPDGSFVGLLRFADLDPDVFDGNADYATTREAVRSDKGAIASSQSIHATMDLLEKSGEDTLAVVQNSLTAEGGGGSMEGRIIGIVQYRDLVRAYNSALRATHGID